MFAEHRRALLLLRDESLRPLWFARFLEQAAEWAALVALLAAAWTSGGAFLAASVLLVRLLPRPVAALLPADWLTRFRTLSLELLGLERAVLAAAIAVALALVGTGGQAAWLVGGAAGMGVLAALGGEARRAALLHYVEKRQVGVFAQADSLIDRVAMVIGTLASGLLLLFASDSSGLIVAALALAAAGLVGWRPAALALTAPSSSPVPAIPPSGVRPSVTPAAAIFFATAFGSGALAVSLTFAAFPAAAIDLRWESAAAGILLALIGIGMLGGPVPVPRVLLRAPAAGIALGLAAVAAAGAVITVAVPGLLLKVPALLLLGLVAVTQDRLRSIAIRRLAPPDTHPSAERFSVLAVSAGQLLGAVLALVWPAGGHAGLVTAVAVGQVLLVGVAAAVGVWSVGGMRRALEVGGLSHLPVKSVVHTLSWETNPEPSSADFAGSSPRVRRLASWIGRRVTPQRLTVTLPLSRRDYEIYRPDDDSRERLFDEGRSDPEKQMPYWSKVWPSGVALADVVVERESEVAGRYVLELGAGLGVTACAVIRAGGRLVTADYSALPLAHCRLNTLANTGAAPRSMCFNWRHPAEIQAAARRPDFAGGFPLILGADLLYEGRDSEPLLEVVDLLLAADGELWLAEPVRRTAQRFLDSAAELGWQTESRQVQADWPDATSGPVNVHFLTRSPYPDQITADVGGWRL